MTVRTTSSMRVYANDFMLPMQYGLQDVSMVIIANKCDLELKRIVPKELGEQVL